MDKHHHPKGLSYRNIFGLLILLIGGGVAYTSLKIQNLQEELSTLKEELRITERAHSQRLSELASITLSLKEKTIGLSEGLNTTVENLSAVRNKVGGVEQAVGVIGSTIGDLKKLAETDEELLNKYSKVYFLNENYTPLNVVTISPEYTYSNTRSEQFLREAWPFLKDLLDAAKQDNVALYVKSGYRSFDEQKSLKSFYSVTYGAGTANTFSADQGYSEHQLGTTIDFITSGLDGKLEGFDKTKAYEWLLDNAHKYGFIVSYPKGNGHYIFEPWHFRFVGIKLATYLHITKKNFYDLDQRDIDTYRIHMFDR